MLPKARGIQVLHEPQGHASRGKARRVDPQTCRVVGTSADAQEQRGCVGRSDVRADSTSNRS